MRHTRNRQIAKAMKDNSWFELKNNKIGSKANNCSELDRTFKWHRESKCGGNWIEFGGDGYRYGVLLQAKACYKTLKGLTKQGAFNR